MEEEKPISVLHAMVCMLLRRPDLRPQVLQQRLLDEYGCEVSLLTVSSLRNNILAVLRSLQDLGMLKTQVRMRPMSRRSHPTLPGQAGV